MRVHPGHKQPTTIGTEWGEKNPFIRIWRGLDEEGSEPVSIGPADAEEREAATLVLWAPDYDGGNKAWVRFEDGSDAIVGGSASKKGELGMNWKTGSAVALAGVALVLTGCVEFQGDVKGKQISNDEVRVKFKICDDINPNCNPEPMEIARRGAEETKVLLAFRTPKGTDMPKDVRPKGIDITFNGSNSYTDEMNAKAPRKPNEKWHGYISEDITGQSAAEAKFKLVLGLPNKPGKSFNYRPAVGYVDGAPESSVTCAEDVQDGFDDGDTDFVCVDDPEEPVELGKSLKIPLD